MRHAFLLLLALSASAGSLLGAGPKRQSVPIGGEWNISAASLERAKVAGKRVELLVAKGDAKLKRGRDALMGPWIMEASAEVIECDFSGKRFIVRGPYVITKSAGGVVVSTFKGSGPESTAEIGFRDAALKITGPNRTILSDARESAQSGAGTSKGEPR